MPSIRSKFLNVILRLMRVKRDMNQLEQRVASGQRTNAQPTARQRRKFRIDSRTVDGHKVWTIAPRSNPSGQFIVYLHGGVFVSSFASQHWGFMAKLVEELDCTIVAPDYPHAPEYYAPETVALVQKIYRETLEVAENSHQITIMGDSSGGGIAVALTLRLREEGLPQPRNLVLLSPWLDVTLTNPEIAAIDRIDPFLDAEGMRWAGRAYAREVDHESYLVSPFSTNLGALAPISLFIGTRDLLLPDCRRFRRQAEADGAVIDYHEYPDMVHNWMLVPLPEAKRVFDSIVRTLSPVP